MSLFASEKLTDAKSNFGSLPVANAGVSFIAKPLKWIGKAGSKGFRNYSYFLMGESNHRINPVQMMLIMAYLENRAADDSSGCTDGCQWFTKKETRDAINSKIKRVTNALFTLGRLKGDVTKGEQEEFTCSIYGFTHGDMFELMAIAFYQALFEAGVSEYEILDVERRLEVQLRHQPVKGQAREYRRNYIRFTDIVVKGQNPLLPIGIELKSIQAAKKDDTLAQKKSKKVLGKFPQWRVGKGGRSSYHRQYTLDNIARTSVDIPGEDNAIQTYEDFQWWFHEWKPRSRENTTRKGRTIKGFDNGVPPSNNPNGKEGNDLELIAQRLATAPHRKAKFKTTVGLETLKPRLPNGKWYIYEGLEYQVERSEWNKKVRAFNFFEVMKSESQRFGVDAASEFDIPPEIEAKLREVSNIGGFWQDYMDDLDKIDIFNLNTDGWHQSLSDFYGDLYNPISRNCDP